MLNLMKSRNYKQHTPFIGPLRAPAVAVVRNALAQEGAAKGGVLQLRPAAALDAQGVERVRKLPGVPPARPAVGEALQDRAGALAAFRVGSKSL